MAILIASSASVTNTSGGNDDNRQTFVMSDNRILVVYGSGVMSYRSCADGITWTAPASITGTGTGGQTVQAATQVGDVIYLWQSTASGLGCVTCTYNTGTQLLTGVQTNPVIAFAQPTSLAAGHDTSSGRFYTACAIGNQVIMDSPAADLLSATGSSSGAVASGASLAVCDIAVIPSGTSTIYVLYTTTIGLFVFPMTYNGTNFITGAPEIVASGSISSAACALNASNQLDIVWMSGGYLYTRTRTGTSVYSSALNIASSCNTAHPALSLSTAAGSALRVFVSSVANQANGEIVLISRTSGTWQIPLLAAGGSSAGFTLPKVSAGATTGRMDLLYQDGADVYYLGAHIASAPSAPIISSPSGNETSLTPTITGTYVNTSAPTDPMSAVEYTVTRVSDAFVMWDSGEITASSIAQVYGTGSNTGDVNYVAPTSLSYGIQYSIKVRTWDTLSGPPVVGPYSSGTLFTPVQGGTVTITNIVDDGTTFTVSPSTIDSPVITSTLIGWSQPQTHTATQYRRRIYANDGVTLVADEGAQTIGGGLASGASLTLGTWSPGLANATPYKFRVDLLDGTTNLWSSSAQWTLNTSWAPPAAPSSFLALAVQHPGYIVLSWTNPGAAVSVLVERSLSGAGDWVTLSTDLRTTLTDYAPLDAWDYRVSIFDSTGVQSGYATASAEIGADGIFGVSLVDTTNTAVWCWFGPVNDWKQASSFDEPSDVQSTSPFGASKLTKSRRFLDYSASKQREFAVPPDGPYYHGGDDFFQRAAIQTFRAMGKAGNAVWYRDINGDAFYVSVENVQRSIGQDGEPMRRLQWDMDEVNGPGGPANPRMPFVR